MLLKCRNYGISRQRRFSIYSPRQYVIYADSHSRGDDTLEKKIRRLDGLLDIVLHTLARIEMPQQEREKYEQMAEIDDAKQRLDAAFRYGDKALLETSYSKLRAMNAADRKLQATYALGKIEPLRRMRLFAEAGMKIAKGVVKRVIRRVCSVGRFQRRKMEGKSPAPSACAQRKSFKPLTAKER